MTSILTTLGVGTGIDTPQLVASLVAAQRAPRDAALNAKAERTVARISALGQVRAGLDAFAGALDSLTRGGSLAPQPRSGDATVVGITRDPALTTPAAPVSATIEVTRLAAAQTLTSPRFATREAPVGHGTLTIAMGRATTAGGMITGFAADGARAPVTITIDATNDSLAGMRDAINAARAGVTASIVDDGQGARLSIKGAMGAADGFTIDAIPASGSPAGLALADFAFTPGTSTMALAAAATDSRLLIDGLAVERASNVITDLLPGFVLDLKRSSLGQPVLIDAARDPATLRAAVQDFVGAYNEMNRLLGELSAPRSDISAAGPLHGQAAVRQLRGDLAGLTARPLASGSASASLAEVGVKTARDGSLSLDTAALDRALASDPALLDRLFTPSRATDSAAVTVASASSLIKPGQYQVTGITAATAGRLTGATVPTAFDFPGAIDSTNASFTAMLDGLGPLTLNLAIGSYVTGASLASAFQAAVNSSPAALASGRSITVGWDTGRFLFLSHLRAATSNVSLGSLDPALAARLGLDTASASAGTDSAGLIAGVAAIGRGSTLIASASSAASGLTLDIGSAAPATARVDVTEGLSGALARIRDGLARGDGGLVTAEQRLTREQRALVLEAQTIERRSDEYEATLTRQFSGMERAVNSYKAVGNFLTQQIDMWSNRDR